ncbi:hypothetical protein HBZC1_p0390 (plasmid) [Helicobacter bizzozeronii CIII-1]|uniref:Uncharacterized protein n=1 Tax=Helicobacter bizzozeronii (strain CIII-1) TaxID=1002804 RepID=F8KUI4_HELBC|nr:hypothetical protein HBZC1_p0390 [Helicobacter bizzozeronii CIII-1]
MLFQWLTWIALSGVFLYAQPQNFTQAKQRLINLYEQCMEVKSSPFSVLYLKSHTNSREVAK